MAQFDHGAVGIADIQRVPVAARAEPAVRTPDHIEFAGSSNDGQVGRFDDEAEVVETAVDRFAGHEVDDRGLVDADRRKGHVAALPLVDPQGFETEEIPIPTEGSFDVGADQNDVVECGNLERFCHPAIVALRSR